MRIYENNIDQRQNGMQRGSRGMSFLPGGTVISLLACRLGGGQDFLSRAILIPAVMVAAGKLYGL